MSRVSSFFSGHPKFFQQFKRIGCSNVSLADRAKPYAKLKWGLALVAGSLLSLEAFAVQCSYAVSNDWGSGFTANITVTNDGASAINGWQVQWQQNGGSTVTSSWNATVSGSNPYTARPVDWNGTIAPGASQSFGLQGNGDNSTGTILGCTANGASTSSVSSISSTPASSTPASSTPASSRPASSTPASSMPASSSSSSSANTTELTLQENATGFCNLNGTIDSNFTGFTGSGFANTENAVGSGVEWRVRASAGEYHSLTWRYANLSANNRAGRVLVNGVAAATVAFPTTGAWNSWTEASANVALNAGENTIRLEAVSAEGLGNIDSLTVVGSNPQAVTCGGSNSSSSSAMSSRSSSSIGAGNDGNYYVAVDGSDSNPGTMARPFATLQKAINVAGAGQLVYVRGGVYRITNPTIPSAGIHFSKSGTSANNRIRYFAFPGERPVLDFANLRIQPDPSYTAGVSVTGAYLHIKGFEIRNVPMNTRSNTGVAVGGGAHHDIFELLDIHHIAGTGMFINTTTGGHLVLNSDSHDNYDPRSHQGDGQNADGFGVHYQKTGEPTIFRGCRAWWNSDDGWDFISQEVPVIVENSWGIANGYINSGTARPASGNGAGFKIGSSKTGIRHVVRNNLAWGNRNQGFYANHSAGGNDWYNNTAYNNGVQYDMWASSWDSNGNRTDGVILTGSKRHRMRNNIGYPNKTRNMQGVDEQFNSWNLGITPRESDFMSLSDAGYRGPRNADGSLPVMDFLKLRAGSQMIDKGTNVGLPYSGSAPDLGAYER